MSVSGVPDGPQDGPRGGVQGARPRSRGEEGATALRNATVTLATVLVVAGLAVFTPGLLPDLLPSTADQAVQAPPPDAGSAPDTPQVRGEDGGSYRFAAVQPDRPDQPVTYDACEVIEVEVNLDDAPDPEDDLRLVLDGLQRINDATGLDLRYTGPSERRPDWSRGSFELSEEDLADPAPVLVSFATAGEVRELQGEVAGIAGSVVVDDGDRARYLTGEVTLDADAFADLREQPDGRAVAEAITLHELAHLVGLDHVDDERELMFAVTTDQRDLGPGDREGLRRLGGGSC